jgi:hypothetical protein
MDKHPHMHDDIHACHVSCPLDRCLEDGIVTSYYISQRKLGYFVFGFFILQVPLSYV